MPLEYKPSIGLEAIMPVLDEYVVWYGRLVKSYFEGIPSKYEPPAVFSEWLTKAAAEKNISPHIAERLKRIHQGMVGAATAFTSKYLANQGSPLKEYAELNRHYEEFIQIMRRLELDHALENSGYDERTGLRSLKVMADDISREMERRARQGNPFALALVKINNFKEDWRGKDDVCNDMVRRISDQIKICLRSFDDAYYMGDEYFLLALKHADMVGAQAAVARLNKDVTAAHIPVAGDPLAEISVSTIIYEPTQGDKLQTLLENMKRDLDGIDEKGTVLQYNDVSPLQRYIHSIDKDK